MSRSHHVANTPLRVLFAAGLVASAAVLACEGKAVSPTGPRVSGGGEAAATHTASENGQAVEFAVTPDPGGLGPVAPGVALPVQHDSNFCYYDNAGYCLSQTGNPPVWDYSSKNGYYKPCSTGRRAGTCKEGTLFSCYCNTP